MIAFLDLVLQSRTACSVLAVLAVVAGLWGWHRFDRSSAVRHAVVEYVAKAELTSVRAELAELKRRRAVAALWLAHDQVIVLVGCTTDRHEIQTPHTMHQNPGAMLLRKGDALARFSAN